MFHPLVAGWFDETFAAPTDVQRAGWAHIAAGRDTLIAAVARLLVGAGRCEADGTPRCAIVDTGHRRTLQLRIEVPDHELGAIASHELQAAVTDRIAALVRTHRTTIVFVNTRRLVERVAHALGERLGGERVGAHHGSMSRAHRRRARLRSVQRPGLRGAAGLVRQL